MVLSSQQEWSDIPYSEGNIVVSNNFIVCAINYKLNDMLIDLI